MAFDNPRLDKIFQIGILVKDIEAVKKNYEELLGIGPWSEVGTISGKKWPIYVNGERFEGDFFKVSMLHRYGFEIELIEPLDPSPLKDWVDKHGNGLHHIDFRINDPEKFDEFIEDAKKMTGEELWLDARFGQTERISFTYIDMTDQLGCYVEVKPKDPRQTEERPGFEY